MTVSRLMQKIVSTQRMTATGGHKREFATHLEEVYCAIQPAGREASDFSNGAFYNAYNMYCEIGTDIVVGDRVIEGSNTYTVKGVATRDYGNNASNHLAISLVLGL